MGNVPAISAFEKRLKRHVVGRVREWFAVTAPGLEKWCQKELTDPPVSITEVRPKVGGVMFKGRLDDCFRANYHLRTANRILMRLDRFKATGFARFEKKAGQIPWEIYLPPGSRTMIHVKSRHCRLHHSQALKERIERAIRQRIAEHTPEKSAINTSGHPQGLFIRGIDDRFTISLDSSGEHLHRRSLKTQRAVAPLRETLAAAILKIADYRPGEPLIDPMCGTGTFSIEAAMVSLKIPAGKFRRFAFEAWPAFRPARWKYIRSEGKKAEIVPTKPFVFASDRGQAACRRLSRILTRVGLSQAIHIAHMDFFDEKHLERATPPGLVVLNPPYGRRLGTPRQSGQTIIRICRHLSTAYHGWRYALLIPKTGIDHPMIRSSRITEISHGGLNLCLLTGRIP